MNNETYNISLSAEDMATVITCLYAGYEAIEEGKDMGNITPAWIDKVRMMTVRAMLAKADEA